jgi:hypothetical protein
MVDDFAQYNRRQLFDIAKNCFNANAKAAPEGQEDRNALFNLSRGLAALTEAIERELQSIRSDVRRNRK